MTIHVSISVLVLLGILIIGIAVLFLWWRRTSSGFSDSEYVVNPSKHFQLSGQKSPFLPKSPLVGVNFSSALNDDVLIEGINRFGRESLNYSLAVNGANLVIQAIEAGKRFGTLNIAYEFSAQGSAMVREGVAKIATHSTSGQLLPELQDRGGRIIELAKGHSRA